MNDAQGVVFQSSSIEKTKVNEFIHNIYENLNTHQRKLLEDTLLSNLRNKNINPKNTLKNIVEQLFMSHALYYVFEEPRHFDPRLINIFNTIIDVNYLRNSGDNPYVTNPYADKDEAVNVLITKLNKLAQPYHEQPGPPHEPSSEQPGPPPEPSSEPPKPGLFSSLFRTRKPRYEMPRPNMVGGSRKKRKSTRRRRIRDNKRHRKSTRRRRHRKY
jgi:hypothetical protein